VRTPDPRGLSHDISYRSHVYRPELARDSDSVPPRPLHQDGGPDCNSADAEPPHAINQIFLEPILFEHSRGASRASTLSTGRRSKTVVQDTSADVSLRDLEPMLSGRLSCRYLIGATARAPSSASDPAPS